MKQWFEKIGRKFETWMVGRYGTDELSKCMVWIGLILMIGSMFNATRFLYIPAWIIIILSYMRCFSKNIVKRSRERDRYMRMTEKIRNKFSLWKRMWSERKNYKYFKCPECKTMVRVPRNKGKIAITCRRCRHEFIKTT